MATMVSQIPDIKSLPSTLGSFNFVQDLPIYEHETPYQVVGTLPPEQEHLRSNLTFKEYEVPIYDLREKFDSSSLEGDAFEYLKRPDLSEHDHELGDDNGLEAYLLKIVEILKAHCDAEHIVIYNYNFRKSGLVPRVEETSNIHSLPGAPVNDLHTDGTYQYGLDRVRLHLNPEEAAKYLDGSWRVRILTIWRPLNTVIDAPLAMCHPASVAESDLLAVSRPNHTDYTGRINYLKYNPKQQFFWMSEQKPDEAVIFTAFDSARPQKIVAHGSFIASNPLPNSRVRQSVDVRAIVISKK